MYMNLKHNVEGCRDGIAKNHRDKLKVHHSRNDDVQP